MSRHISGRLHAVTAGAAILVLAGVAAPAAAGTASPAGPAHGVTAYVANQGSGTVTPIRTATGRAGPAIPVGSRPSALAATPDGKTVYVASSAGVTPVRTASGHADRAIPLAWASLAITPDGRVLYVLDSYSVVPVSTRTNTARPPVSVGGGSVNGMAFTPDSTTAYVVAEGAVTPVRTATGKAGAAIPAGGNSITVTPDGKTAYVVGEGAVVPIRTATNKAGKPIKIPVNHEYSPWYTAGAQELVVSTPDSRTVYAASPTASVVVPISTAAGRAGRPITVGRFPYTMAITPDGRTLVVLSQDDTVSLISTVTNRVRATVHLGTFTVWMTMHPLAITPDGRTAYVAGYALGTVTPISIAAGRAGRPITVGSDPVAVAISPARR